MLIFPVLRLFPLWSLQKSPPFRIFRQISFVYISPENQAPILHPRFSGIFMFTPSFLCLFASSYDFTFNELTCVRILCFEEAFRGRAQRDPATSVLCRKEVPKQSTWSVSI